ncbi:MAG TPA: HD domain-containing protein [Opitutaceae bacterium]|jgi:3'-5' exoribonuclease
MADSSLPLQTVRELKSGDASSKRPFASLLVLRKLTTKTASNGNQFLSVELGDKTGSFGSTVFSDSPVYEILRTAVEGSVARIEGQIESYQGRLSPRLSRIALVDPDQVGSADVLANLVETAPEDPDGLWAEFDGFVESIKRPELRATVRHVLEEIGETFRTSPAATRIHHAYRHGLLEHTVHMARAARALLPLYPEIDPDLAMAGILVHDVGKTIEYEGTVAARKSRQGILHGHVVLGYQLVRRAALRAKLDPERMERLEHIVLSHQGLLEWGAAALAATPEAIFVSKVDDLDAKMGAVQRALRNAQPGEQFSESLKAFDGPLLLRRLPD